MFAGRAPGPLFPIPQEEEDTPRTYRSETHRGGRGGRQDKRSQKRGADEEEHESAVITATETRDMLEKTFAHFRRAIVSTVKKKTFC